MTFGRYLFSVFLGTFISIMMIAIFDLKAENELLPVIILLSFILGFHAGELDFKKV